MTAINREILKAVVMILVEGRKENVFTKCNSNQDMHNWELCCSLMAFFLFFFFVNQRLTFIDLSSGQAVVQTHASLLLVCLYRAICSLPVKVAHFIIRIMQLHL